jgi:hypothetical protein
MRSRSRIIFALAVVVIAIVFTVAPWHKEIASVAVHPDATTQPTATGRTLATLTSFHGKVYAGYGDYGANTGPISLRAFDPRTHQFSDPLLHSETEAIYIFRTLTDRLYAPHIDPSGNATNGGYAVLDDLVSADRTPVRAVHIFDIATLTGSDLWMAGSDGNDAVIWRSDDGGKTWSESLREAPTNVPFTRFYGLIAFRGKLITQKSEYGVQVSKVFDGSKWSAGPNLLPPGGILWHPEVFADRMVYQTNHAGIRASPLYCFDGQHTEIALSPKAVGQSGRGAEQGVYDFTITGDRLYTLAVDEQVQVTRDLKEWRVLAVRPPKQARSLCVCDGRLFIGGTGGEIYEAPLP